MTDVNYTDEMVAEVVADYQAADSVNARDEVVTAYAEKFGKSVASIRAKLVREGVYVAKVKAEKAEAGARGMNKEELVNAVRIFVGARDGQLDSLVKATRNDLRVLVDCLTKLNDKFDAQ